MATQSNANQNDRLAAAVRERLAQYTPLRVSGDGIQVSAQNGTVILSGAVRSRAIKETAERLARQVKGTSTIQNQFTVDGDTEVAVAQALAMDSRTRAGFPGILVGVVYGVGILKGSAGSPEMKSAAGEIAAKIKGVLRVSNELIAPAPPKTAAITKPVAAKAAE